MKKLICMLLALFLPLCALAESPVTLESTVPLYIPGDPIGILDYIQLPDGGTLLNVVTQASLDGLSEGTWHLFYLIRISADGAPVWETRYHAGPGADIITLSLDETTATVSMYNDVIDNANCKLMTLLFDLTTGAQIGEPEELGIPVGEIASVTHCGDFRVDQYYHNGGSDTVRTVITHLPTGRQAEYEFIGLQHCAAFDGKLLCFFVISNESAHYDVYGADCLPVGGSTTIGTGYANHITQDSDTLYIFAWTNLEDPDHRTYTVYPVNEDMKLGKAITAFTLGEDHALGQVAACGDGFLLTDEHPWEHDKPFRYDLLHLSADGTVTTVAPELLQVDAVILLPGTDTDHVRVILWDETGSGYCQRVYTAK